MRPLEILLSLAILLTFCILAISAASRDTLDRLFGTNHGANSRYTDTI